MAELNEESKFKNLFKTTGLTQKQPTEAEIKAEQEEWEADCKRCNEREKALENIEVDYLLLELDPKTTGVFGYITTPNNKIKIEFKNKTLKEIRDSLVSVRSVIYHDSLYHEDQLGMY